MTTTAKPRVLVRLCPDCGGAIDGRPGSVWFSCRICPSAFDRGSEPAVRVDTFRARSRVDDAPAAKVIRLPFYLFVSVSETSAAPALWVAAFRLVGAQLYGDPAAKLAESEWVPELERAPLGAPIERGPHEAVAIAKVLLGQSPSAAIPFGAPRLVSLAAKVEGDMVREAIGGTNFPVRAIRPRRIGGAE